MPDWVTPHIAIIVTTGSTFLTTVAGFIYTWLREERRHRWQLEREMHHESMTAGMARQLADLHQALK